jgi:tRNA pseudouridine55 synthase
LLIDKPAGWTSHDAVAVVRRRLGQRSVGHSGTLDPFATGLLVVLVGRATRLARFLEAATKRYDAVIRFGTATATDDGTGTVTAERRPDAWPNQATLEAVLAGFVGHYQQRPPAYSAKHVEGQRSYRLARAGRAVDLAPVAVTIEALTCLAWRPPDLVVRASVGKGTYLRALARDIGERLDIPAHCHALRRTGVGPFEVAEAVAPDAVTAASLRSPADMVSHLPRVALGRDDAAAVGFGRAVPRDDTAASGPAALVGPDGRLVGMAEARDTVWQPVVVLEPA